MPPPAGFNSRSGMSCFSRGSANTRRFGSSLFNADRKDADDMSEQCFNLDGDFHFLRDLIDEIHH
jgi:hypothetical protein